MRGLFALLAIMLLSVGAIACGEASKRTGSTHKVSSDATTMSGTVATIPLSTMLTGRSLNGDGDADNPSDIDGDEKADHDHDDDSPTKESKNYHDNDDNDILDYGLPADAADRQAVTALVKRYYGAAAAGDGATACSLILSSIARSVPETYGRGAGPAYLSGGKTCEAIMSLLFKHIHRQLTGTLEVTGVRINGEQAFVLLGSTMMRASYLILQREVGAWKIAALLGGPLP